METQRRFGNRARIAEPATLLIDGRRINGRIENVGLGGAFFTTLDPPTPGITATLMRNGGRGVPVRVMWQRTTGPRGVGLRFDESV